MDNWLKHFQTLLGVMAVTAVSILWITNKVEEVRADTKALVMDIDESKERRLDRFEEKLDRMQEILLELAKRR